MRADAHGDRAARAARLDFATNLNPYGPCPAVVRAARAAALTPYPDPDATLAREAWARRLGSGPERVLIGHGASELIWTAVRALLRAGEPALELAPAFGEFAAAVEQQGGVLRRTRAAAAAGFVHAPAEILRACRDARLIYVCEPSSPTGRCLGHATLAALAADTPAAYWLLDESFLTLSERAADLGRPLPGNVLRLRSLTKDHALAGLRVGYLWAEAPLVRRIAQARPPWTVSAPAQAAAAAAARQAAFEAESWRRVRADRERLRDGLRALGLAPLPSETLFQLVEVGDAAAVAERLLRAHGVAVRPCGSFGLPRHLRLAARPAAERAALLSALREAL